MTQTSWAYTDAVKEHFMNPRNILMDEDSYEEDGKGITGNVKCGDEMIVVIKVDKEKGIITDCKWKTYGCASAIGSTSILSEMVKGMDKEVVWVYFWDKRSPQDQQRYSFRMAQASNRKIGFKKKWAKALSES